MLKPEALLFGSTGHGFITLLHLAPHHGQDVRRVEDVLVEVSHTCPPSQGHCFPFPLLWMFTAFRGHGRRARALLGRRDAHETLDHLVGLTITHPSQVPFTLLLHYLRCHSWRSEIQRADILGIVLLANNLSRRIRAGHDARVYRYWCAGSEMLCLSEEGSLLVGNADHGTAQRTLGIGTIKK